MNHLLHLNHSCNEQAHQRYNHVMFYEYDPKSYLEVAKPFERFPAGPGENWDGIIIP